MNDYELINLTLDEIRRQAYNLHNTMTNMEYAESITPFRKVRINQMRATLDETRTKLREILENISEYNNAIDNTHPLDVALSEVPFDLIYERKSEKDYEGQSEDPISNSENTKLLN